MLSHYCLLKVKVQISQANSVNMQVKSFVITADRTGNTGLPCGIRTFGTSCCECSSYCRVTIKLLTLHQNPSDINPLGKGRSDSILITTSWGQKSPLSCACGGQRTGMGGIASGFIITQHGWQSQLPIFSLLYHPPDESGVEMECLVIA